MDSQYSYELIQNSEIRYLITESFYQKEDAEQYLLEMISGTKKRIAQAKDGTRPLLNRTIESMEQQLKDLMKIKIRKVKRGR